MNATGAMGTIISFSVTPACSTLPTPGPSRTGRFDSPESNPQATRLIWFDQVDIPGVEKLCLAGSDLVDTQLYQDYLAHGQIWYVVFEAQKRGLTMGITRNSVVTLFSKSTKDELINYIREDLLLLIE